MMLESTLRDEAHLAPRGSYGGPFVIGWVNSAKGYVHVFDDTTLHILMGALDTAADFIRYLTKKEALLNSGIPFFAAGEEELLAYYLREVGADGEHTFALRPGSPGMILAEGGWSSFRVHPQRLAQQQADNVSYFWDDLIERFAHHIVHGTSYYNSTAAFADQELLLRALAKEDRLHRRILSSSLLEIVASTPAHLRFLRVVPPYHPDQPHYVFILVPWLDKYTEEQNRTARRHYLEAAVLVCRLMRPEAHTVIGIATESGPNGGRSEDVMMLDATEWTPEMEAEALALQQELGLMTNITEHPYSVSEYPESSLGSTTFRAQSRGGQPSRNRPCPCGSRKSYKNCHGR